MTDTPQSEKDRLFKQFQGEFQALLDKYDYRLLPTISVTTNGIVPEVKIVPNKKPVVAPTTDAQPATSPQTPPPASAAAPTVPPAPTQTPEVAPTTSNPTTAPAPINADEKATS